MGDCRRAESLWRRASLAIALASPPSAQARRPLNVDDIYNLKEVRDPQRSPDGKWVAYTVTRAIKDTDKNDTDVWMVSWDGQQQVQLTSTPEGESLPGGARTASTCRSSRRAREPRAARSGC